jgi:hypothetical protein
MRSCRRLCRTVHFPTQRFYSTEIDAKCRSRSSEALMAPFSRLCVELDDLHDSCQQTRSQTDGLSSQVQALRDQLETTRRELLCDVEIHVSKHVSAIEEACSRRAGLDKVIQERIRAALAPVLEGSATSEITQPVHRPAESSRKFAELGKVISVECTSQSSGWSSSHIDNVCAQIQDHVLLNPQAEDTAILTVVTKRLKYLWQYEWKVFFVLEGYHDIPLKAVRYWLYIRINGQNGKFARLLVLGS